MKSSNFDVFVSVIMSCYNREAYVLDAIESILNQTHKNFEFIIIDDASKDATPEIIKKCAERDSRIIFIQNSENKGCTRNFNTGLSIAKGKYIARMDDDDISLPTRFEEQIKYLEKHADIVVLGTFMQIISNPSDKGWVNETLPEVLAVMMFFHCPLVHPSVFIRKSFIDEHGLKYSVDAVHAEDYDFWKQVIFCGGKIVNLPYPFLAYRRLQDSICLSPETRPIQEKSADAIKKELLLRLLSDENDIEDFIERTKNIKCDLDWLRLFKILFKANWGKNVVSQIVITKFLFRAYLGHFKTKFINFINKSK